MDSIERKNLTKILTLICAMLVSSVAFAYLANTVAGGLYYVLTELFSFSAYGEGILLHLLNMVIYIIQMSVPALLYIWVAGRIPLPFNCIRGKLSSTKLILFGLCAYSLSYVLSFIGGYFEAIFGLEGVNAELAAPTDALTLIISLVSVALLPALLEEFVFRKLIFASLSPYGAGFAILASALFFASVHSGAPGILYAFGYGVIFAYLVFLTGNIRYSVILHFCNNAYSVFMDYFQGIIPPQLYEKIAVLLNITLISAGLIAGAYLIGKREIFGKTETGGKEKFRALLSPVMLIYYFFVAILLAVDYLVR